ncbi:9408_t:CDS:2 [Cetraspora pellucida]|uniref:9408_t:CDS:1 n=1 Tax=Cetraspora pellucida TaxID=1433469 RepID=A0ACA9M164_9GLOM|nr:9408_t:CDS:2 [Cetraspora pellucida]
MDKTPQPERRRPNSPVDKPENPIVENNKGSQENIEELSHLPLDEAKIKAKKEIETLFDRYGVQAYQLDTRLIKIAIIQQNNKNNQRVANLPLDEAKQATQNEIQELLQKHQIELSRLDKSL